MSPALSPLAPVHAVLIAGMHRISFAEPWDEAAMAGLLAMPGAFGLLAADEAPLGFILCRTAADEAEVLTLMVLPPYRRSGLGGRLLEAACAQAASAGAARMFLEVAADNAAGLALYAARGFLPVGRRPRYYGGRIDALILEKYLGNIIPAAS